MSATATQPPLTLLSATETVRFCRQVLSAKISLDLDAEKNGTYAIPLGIVVELQLSGAEECLRANETPSWISDPSSTAQYRMQLFYASLAAYSQIAICAFFVRALQIDESVDHDEDVSMTAGAPEAIGIRHADPFSSATVDMFIRTVRWMAAKDGSAGRISVDMSWIYPTLFPPPQPDDEDAAADNKRAGVLTYGMDSIASHVIREVRRMAGQETPLCGMATLALCANQMLRQVLPVKWIMELLEHIVADECPEVPLLRGELVAAGSDHEITEELYVETEALALAIAMRYHIAEYYSQKAFLALCTTICAQVPAMSVSNLSGVHTRARDRINLFSHSIMYAPLQQAAATLALEPANQSPSTAMIAALMRLLRLCVFYDTQRLGTVGAQIFFACVANSGVISNLTANAASMSNTIIYQLLLECLSLFGSAALPQTDEIASSVFTSLQLTPQGRKHMFALAADGGGGGGGGCRFLFRPEGGYKSSDDVSSWPSILLNPSGVDVSQADSAAWNEHPIDYARFVADGLQLCCTNPIVVDFAGILATAALQTPPGVVFNESAIWMPFKHSAFSRAVAELVQAYLQLNPVGITVTETSSAAEMVLASHPTLPAKNEVGIHLSDINSAQLDVLHPLSMEVSHPVLKRLQYSTALRLLWDRNVTKLASKRRASLLVAPETLLRQLHTAMPSDKEEKATFRTISCPCCSSDVQLSVLGHHFDTCARKTDNMDAAALMKERLCIAQVMYEHRLQLEYDHLQRNKRSALAFARQMHKRLHEMKALEGALHARYRAESVNALKHKREYEAYHLQENQRKAERVRMSRLLRQTSSTSVALEDFTQTRQSAVETAISEAVAEQKKHPVVIPRLRNIAAKSPLASPLFESYAYDSDAMKNNAISKIDTAGLIIEREPFVQLHHHRSFHPASGKPKQRNEEDDDAGVVLSEFEKQQKQWWAEAAKLFDMLAPSTRTQGGFTHSTSSPTVQSRAAALQKIAEYSMSEAIKHAVNHHTHGDIEEFRMHGDNTRHEEHKTASNSDKKPANAAMHHNMEKIALHKTPKSTRRAASPPASTTRNRDTTTGKKHDIIDGDDVSHVSKTMGVKVFDGKEMKEAETTSRDVISSSRTVNNTTKRQERRKSRVSLQQFDAIFGLQVGKDACIAESNTSDTTTAADNTLVPRPSTAADVAVLAIRDIVPLTVDELRNMQLIADVSSPKSGRKMYATGRRMSHSSNNGAHLGASNTTARATISTTRRMSHNNAFLVKGKHFEGVIPPTNTDDDDNSNTSNDGKDVVDTSAFEEHALHTLDATAADGNSGPGGLMLHVKRVNNGDRPRRRSSAAFFDLPADAATTRPATTTTANTARSGLQSSSNRHRNTAMNADVSGLLQVAGVLDPATTSLLAASSSAAYASLISQLLASNTTFPQAGASSSTQPNEAAGINKASSSTATTTMITVPRLFGDGIVLQQQITTARFASPHKHSSKRTAAAREGLDQQTNTQAAMTTTTTASPRGNTRLVPSLFEASQSQSIGRAIQHVINIASGRSKHHRHRPNTNNNKNNSATPASKQPNNNNSNSVISSARSVSIIPESATLDGSFAIDSGFATENTTTSIITTATTTNSSNNNNAAILMPPRGKRRKSVVEMLQEMDVEDAKRAAAHNEHEDSDNVESDDDNDKDDDDDTSSYFSEEDDDFDGSEELNITARTNADSAAIATARSATLNDATEATTTAPTAVVVPAKQRQRKWKSSADYQNNLTQQLEKKRRARLAALTNNQRRVLSDNNELRVCKFQAEAVYATESVRKQPDSIPKQLQQTIAELSDEVGKAETRAKQSFAARDTVWWMQSDAASEMFSATFGDVIEFTTGDLLSLFACKNKLNNNSTDATNNQHHRTMWMNKWDVESVIIDDLESDDGESPRSNASLRRTRSQSLLQLLDKDIIDKAVEVATIVKERPVAWDTLFSGTFTSDGVNEESATNNKNLTQTTPRDLDLTSATGRLAALLQQRRSQLPARASPSHKHDYMEEVTATLTQQGSTHQLNNRSTDTLRQEGLTQPLNSQSIDTLRLLPVLRGVVADGSVIRKERVLMEGLLQAYPHSVTVVKPYDVGLFNVHCNRMSSSTSDDAIGWQYFIVDVSRYFTPSTNTLPQHFWLHIVVKEGHPSVITLPYSAVNSRSTPLGEERTETKPFHVEVFAAFDRLPTRLDHDYSGKAVTRVTGPVLHVEYGAPGHWRNSQSKVFVGVRVTAAESVCFVPLNITIECSELPRKQDEDEEDTLALAHPHDLDNDVIMHSKGRPEQAMRNVDLYCRKFIRLFSEFQSEMQRDSNIFISGCDARGAPWHEYSQLTSRTVRSSGRDAQRVVLQRSVERVSGTGTVRRKRVDSGAIGTKPAAEYVPSLQIMKRMDSRRRNNGVATTPVLWEVEYVDDSDPLLGDNIADNSAVTGRASIVTADQSSRIVTHRSLEDVHLEEGQEVFESSDCDEKLPLKTQNPTALQRRIVADMTDEDIVKLMAEYAESQFADVFWNAWGADEDVVDVNFPSLNEIVETNTAAGDDTVAPEESAHMAEGIRSMVTDTSTLEVGKSVDFVHEPSLLEQPFMQTPSRKKQLDPLPRSASTMSVHASLAPSPLYPTPEARRLASVRKMEKELRLTSKALKSSLHRARFEGDATHVAVATEKKLRKGGAASSSHSSTSKMVQALVGLASTASLPDPTHSRIF